MIELFKLIGESKESFFGTIIILSIVFGFLTTLWYIALNKFLIFKHGYPSIEQAKAIKILEDDDFEIDNGDMY